MKNIP